MESSVRPRELTGPIVVCLEDEMHTASLVRCGVAHAWLEDAPLILVFLIAIPSQRPLGTPTEEEASRANMILDIAAEIAVSGGVEAAVEVWIARSRANPPSLHGVGLLK